MSYRRWGILWFSLTLFGLLAIAAINYLVDPIQFYRKAAYAPVFATNERVQNAGLVRTYNYDTIIIGTSTSQNFIPSYVDSHLGTKSLKLAAKGSSLGEQYLTARLAFNNRPVRNVIWGVDMTSAAGQFSRERDSFPSYLYDEHEFNDLKYLVNGTTTLQSIMAAARTLGIDRQKPQPIDYLYNWNSNFKFDRKFVLEEWEREQAKGLPVKIGDYAYARFTENLDSTVIKLAREYPETRFIVFFPPYSILFQKDFYSKNSLTIENWAKAKYYLYTVSETVPNLEVYDFQDDSAIIYNFDLYKDMMHYSEDVNKRIINQIKLGHNRLTKENAERRMSDFISAVANYKLK